MKRRNLGVSIYNPERQIKIRSTRREVEELSNSAAQRGWTLSALLIEGGRLLLQNLAKDNKNQAKEAKELVFS